MSAASSQVAEMSRRLRVVEHNANILLQSIQRFANTHSVESKDTYGQSIRAYQRAKRSLDETADWQALEAVSDAERMAYYELKRATEDSIQGTITQVDAVKSSLR